MVWTQGDSELIVRSHAVALACARGVISMTIPVRCDQLTKDAVMTVPFAVGTAERATGLFMSSFTRVAGSDVPALQGAGDHRSSHPVLVGPGGRHEVQNEVDRSVTDPILHDGTEPLAEARGGKRADER